MPTYAFKCESCEHCFDAQLAMKDNDTPLKNPCPSCGKKKILRDYTNERTGFAIDATLTANKATGGAWNELMAKMKPTLTTRHKRSLDAASELRGGGG
jgi:putative FmdB family regulatory protein